MLVWFALILANQATAQAHSFEEIERFITTQPVLVNSSKDLDTLAKLIIQHYPDSLSRVKAAYIWVAKNISYNETDGAERHTATTIDSVLKYKTTICSGYVNVFSLLCEKEGIVCKEIEGFGKTGTKPFLNTSFSVNHAWAAVWLNGKWNLADVTWGSGYTLEGTKQFISQTSNWYFFTDPETFILDHYPKKSEWQLLQDTVSWEKFVSYPVICLGAKENEISNCFPAATVIRTIAGERIHFSFTSKKPLQSIVLFSKQRGFKRSGIVAQKQRRLFLHVHNSGGGAIRSFDRPEQ